MINTGKIEKMVMDNYSYVGKPRMKKSERKISNCHNFISGPPDITNQFRDHILVLYHSSHNKNLCKRWRVKSNKSNQTSRWTLIHSYNAELRRYLAICPTIYIIVGKSIATNQSYNFYRHTFRYQPKAIMACNFSQYVSSEHHQPHARILHRGI